MSESEIVEIEGTSFTIGAQGLSIGQNDQLLKLTPRGTWDLLDLLDKHRGELFQPLHPESIGTDQQVREFVTHYVCTSYDVGSFRIDRCSRVPQEEGDSPDEWEVLISWGNDEFTLVIRMYDELTVISIDDTGGEVKDAALSRLLHHLLEWRCTGLFWCFSPKPTRELDDIHRGRSSNMIQVGFTQTNRT